MSGKRGKGAKGDTGALEQAAKAERALLRAEREAEQRLDEARARLAKAETRLLRRQAAVAEAEATLRACQAARAAGPEPAPSPEPAPDAPADPDDLVVVATPLAKLTAKPKRAPRKAASVDPVLSADGPAANGAGVDDLPEVAAPSPAKPVSRRRKTAARVG
jgi:hypothetical protein